MRQVNIKVIDTEEFNSGINKKIVNNLNTKEEGYLLDASQGKVLDEKKVDKNNISNSLSVEEEGYVLDARQGKILEDKIQKVIGDIDVINGTGEGSISKYVNDAITNLIAEAPESFDTLKEISNWISTHSDSASAMNTSISQLQSDLASHTHLYAGSSSAGGAATSANKINTNAGSALNPVYFSDGIPKACTYSLNKTVPSDAVFTDTKNTAGSTDTSSKIFLIGATSQADNPQTYSHNTAYVGADGCLYSNSTKVSVEGHTHNYAGSSSAGGAATSANKLNTNAGSATQPVYFANGIPVKCTYTLGKSVPSDAVFTDTTYTVNTRMTDLGFTKGSTYTVNELFTKFIEKGHNGKICIRFAYDNNGTAKISDGTTTVDMNGVNCFYSCFHKNAWRKDYALVSSADKLYLFYATFGESTTSPTSQKIIDVTANTKNTAGSTDSSSKLFLIGATSQADNPQTYSHNTAYVGADGCLYSNSTKVSVEGHTHNYAGSSSAGGAATSANKINTNAGSATQPVYFANGIPVKCTYTLGKSVPSDAKFTDNNTTYSAGTGLTLSSTTFSAKIANNLTTTTTGYALDATQGKQLLTYMNGIYGNFGTQLHSTSEINATHYIDLTASLANYQMLEFDCHLTSSFEHMTTIRIPRDWFVTAGNTQLFIQQQSQYLSVTVYYVSNTQIKYTIGSLSGGWSSVGASMTVRLRGLK